MFKSRYRCYFFFSALLKPFLMKIVCKLLSWIEIKFKVDAGPGPAWHPSLNKTWKLQITTQITCIVSIFTSPQCGLLSLCFGIDSVSKTTWQADDIKFYMFISGLHLYSIWQIKVVYTETKTLTFLRYPLHVLLLDLSTDWEYVNHDSRFITSHQCMKIPEFAPYFSAREGGVFSQVFIKTTFLVLGYCFYFLALKTTFLQNKLNIR